MSPTENARSQSLAAEAAEDLGALPEWNLEDLYAGMDDPALTRDLRLAETRSQEFEARVKGTLVLLVARHPRVIGRVGREGCRARLGVSF